MCAVFKQNIKKFNPTARNAFTDTNLLVVMIGEPKNFNDAVCQNLTSLKFSLRFINNMF